MKRVPTFPSFVTQAEGQVKRAIICAHSDSGAVVRVAAAHDTHRLWHVKVVHAPCAYDISIQSDGWIPTSLRHARRRRLNVPFVCCYFFVFDTIELLQSRIRGFVPPYSIPGAKRNTRRTAHHTQPDIAAWARGLAETKPSLCVCG